MQQKMFIGFMDIVPRFWRVQLFKIQEVRKFADRFSVSITSFLAIEIKKISAEKGLLRLVPK